MPEFTDEIWHVDVEELAVGTIYGYRVHGPYEPDAGHRFNPNKLLMRSVEPFFSTNPEGQGTGLGLSMAFGFAKQSGGHLQIYSELGHGTTVKLYFPRSHEAEKLLTPPAMKKAVGGTEIILVVEDDVVVQQTVVEMLSSLGYNILKADNADSAMAVLRAGVHCDLLFTDVVMPGRLKSTELAHQAKTILPDLEVLFTSGYTQNAIVHGGRLDPGVELISKPYRREDLAVKIRQILNRREGNAQNALPPMIDKKDRGAAQKLNRRVLVVEDNKDSQVMTCELLKILGCLPSGVSSSEEAITLLATQPFEVLLTDYKLPGMDGINLAKKAKSIQPHLLIVIASGFGNIADDTPDLDAKTLAKPFDINSLRDVLSSMH